MVVKYTLRNLNQLKRDLVIFEAEYQNLIKHQHEDNEDNMSENYDICRRFIENNQNGISIRKKLQDFKDSILSLNEYFKDRNSQIATIRTQLYGKGKNSENNITTKFPFKLPAELIYIDAVSEVIRLIFETAKLFGNIITLTDEIYSKVYLAEKFDQKLNAPLYTSKQLEGLDRYEREEKREEALENMEYAIVNLFKGFSQLSFADYESESLKKALREKLEQEKKEREEAIKKGEKVPPTLFEFYQYVQSYKTDIIKLTFAIRANAAIDLHNKKVIDIHKKHNQDSTIRRLFPKVSNDTFIKKLNMNKSTVSAYLTGKAMPSTEFLLYFSQTVGVSIDYLINPAIPVGYLKQEMSDKSNIHCVDTSIEIGYLMRFLNHRWRHINTATLNQTDLIMTTLTYLMRDLFIDNVDDGIFPTLSKESYPLKKMNASSTASSLTAANDNFNEMVLRYNEGSLRLNKNSLLYLIGRILFDRYPSEDVIPEGLKRFSKDYMIMSGKGSFQRLAFLAQNNCQNPLEYKAIINQLMTEQDELASDYEELLLDCEDDLEQYFKEQLMARLRNTLSVHSNLSKNSTMSDEKLPQFTPYHDYNEDVWDNVQKKYISLKPKDSIMLENNGFSNSYAKFLSPQKSEKENKPKNIAKFCRLTPITIQLGSIESSDYEIRKAVKEYLQAQNVAINEIPNHIELSVEALDDFETMCYAYSTNPQIFDYSYPTLCTVRAFLAQNHIPVAFLDGKQYAPSEKPLVNDLCEIFESNPEFAEKSFEELLKKKNLFSKKTIQIYLNDMKTEEDEE